MCQCLLIVLTLNAAFSHWHVARINWTTVIYWTVTKQPKGRPGKCFRTFISLLGFWFLMLDRHQLLLNLWWRIGFLLLTRMTGQLLEEFIVYADVKYLFDRNMNKKDEQVKGNALLNMGQNHLIVVPLKVGILMGRGMIIDHRSKRRTGYPISGMQGPR